MAGSRSPRGSLNRLADNSRRRRRILLRQSGGELPIADEPLDDPSLRVHPAAEQAVQTPAPSQPVVQQHRKPKSKVLLASPPQLAEVANPAPWMAIQRLLKENRPATWVFAGDSVAHGAKHLQGRRNFSEHFAERVSWELRRLLDVVINTAVSGERVASLLKSLQWRALRFQPDAVFLMIALTDSKAGRDGRNAYRDNLIQLVEQIQSCGAVPVLQTPNQPADCTQTPFADLPAYVEIIWELAEQRDLPLVDHWKHWQQLDVSEKQYHALLASDGIHPGPLGHREMARLLFHSLGIFDASSETCSLATV